MCFSVGIPPATARSGTSGTIYFQITAPSKYAWVALGTGTAMAGSNMFLAYQDGKGNVTLSPRAGTRYVMPQLDQSAGAARLTLLAGSGVVGETMTANVACDNCLSWAGGASTLNANSANTNWIVAWKEGAPLASSDKNTRIAKHDETGKITFDLTQAVIEGDTNPFLQAAGQSGNPGTGNAGGNTNAGGSSSPGASSSTTGTPNPTIILAHGVIMAVVFAGLYPLGSLLMPVFGRWLAHGAWQMVAFLLMWAGLVLGVMAARNRENLFNDGHTILGGVVVVVLGLQPFLGYFHHRHFVSHQRRGAISYVHIWLGRIFMVLGVINGGTGLELSGAPMGAIVAYSVIAAVVYLIYAIGKVLIQLKRKKSANVNGSSSEATRVKREVSGQSSPGRP